MTVILDEIHLLDDPGQAAKIIYDQIPGIKLIITGSSAFNIKNRTAESLAGRKISYYLYPLTFNEYLYQMGVVSELKDSIFPTITEKNTRGQIYAFDLKAMLTYVMTYGLYPEIINRQNSREYLQNLVDSIVFKDILELKLIENRNDALNLLKLLAYQIGNLIHYSELAGRIGIDARTVKRYIQIFEESYLIFRLYPHCSNRRDEVGKAPKIYFYDLGLRNALTEDFSDVLLRRDLGALFENFIISEAIKLNSYMQYGYKIGFWRTTQGAEVDLVVARDKDLIACEVKFGGNKAKVSRSFLHRYPNAREVVLQSSNFFADLR